MPSGMTAWGILFGLRRQSSATSTHWLSRCPHTLTLSLYQIPPEVLIMHGVMTELGIHISIPIYSILIKMETSDGKPTGSLFLPIMLILSGETPDSAIFPGVMN